MINKDCKNTEKTGRLIKYDWLRSIASFAIILVHALPPNPTTYFQWWFHSTITPLLLSFVGIYFMLSGALILKPLTGTLGDFYKKRVISIGLPLILYSFLYSGYDQLINHSSESPGMFLLTALKNLINNTIPYGSHLWFMYTLLALYLCAPFLSKMLYSLSDQELLAFTWIMVIAQGLITYGRIAGLYPPVPIFTGWVLYFILGYSLKHLYHQKHYPIFFVMGLISLLVTLMQKKFFPEQMPNIHDLAPTMIFIAASIFLFFEYFANTKSEIINTIVMFVGKYSYSIYLIHFLILQKFIKPGINTSPIANHYLLDIAISSILTFLLSLFVAFFYDNTIIRLIKRLFP